MKREKLAEQRKKYGSLGIGVGEIGHSLRVPRPLTFSIWMAPYFERFHVTNSSTYTLCDSAISLYLRNVIRVPESLAARIHGLGLYDVEVFGGVLTVPQNNPGSRKKKEGITAFRMADE